MKIGIFTDTYFPQVNGVTYTIDMWKKKLEKKGCEVSIYYPSGEYTPGEREYPFRSFEFRFYKDYRIAVPARISKKTKDLDIIHIHGLFSMAIAALYISKRHKLPKILTYHTPADEYIRYITQKKTLEKTLMRLYNLWEKKLLNSCNIVTCPSEVIKDRLLKKGVKDVTILSNGVDLDHFRQVETDEFRKKHNIKADKIIGFCGRFGYEKHLEDLIELSDEFNGEILIAGKGPAEEYYREIAGNKGNVKFLGFLNRTDILAFYSTLDLFIFPSTAETQGLVALEAMACNTPLVGANALALKDTIQDGVNGYLYESGSKTELMDNIELAYKNRDELSMNCKEYVKQHSVDKSIEELIRIYEGLM
ncbi:MAG: glycosyltransferase [Candidatus Altiarchaeota archaeon]|nr:glycosyltransferase [Candidatus Altiarchaeota archaeon]